MSVKLIKKTLTNEHFTFNSMLFLPSQKSEIRTEWALLTHGYTASKSDCLNWAQRLSEAGIPTIIFDLPGHHLGSYNEVKSFEEFRDHVLSCFETCFELLQNHISSKCSHLIFGGHSLGALLAIKALKLSTIKPNKKLAIGVGIGIGQHKTAHLFETSFYEKTLNIRRQLVDENIDSDLVFPWIKQEKLDLDIENERIHLITGLDDVVVGKGGLEVLKSKLEAKNNNVTFMEPRKLPHHEPAIAATHIYNFLKSELNL
jgi:hypothetical protein